jgi:hypothetical protein
MTRTEIYDLLKSTFNEFDVTIVDKSTWCKILVAPNLEVYTYSGYPDREDSVWYFSLYFNGAGKEVMIPNKDSKEFIHVFKEIYLDVLKSNEILDSVVVRLNNIMDPSNIRDLKIKTIIDYD